MRKHRTAFDRRMKRYTKPRPKIPRDLENSILVRTRHQCCICHTHDVQIHHADNNRANNHEDNLIPLCGNCHNRTSKSGGNTKGYTPEQLRMYRKNWFAKVEIANEVAALSPFLRDVPENDKLPERLDRSKSKGVK